MSEGKEYTMVCCQELSHYSPAVTEKDNEIFYKGINCTRPGFKPGLPGTPGECSIAAYTKL
jgi:hypothetical protein